MMVTFISQCEKKALARTRRVLDAFADRIGDNTWQTVITQEGLLAVKKLLRKTASKNTAVSCHWMRSRSRSELIWVVGNRNKFNAEGIVPVNLTTKEVPMDILIDKPIKGMNYANTHLQCLDQHLFAVGYVAEQLYKSFYPEDNAQANAVFIAGCIHDLGKLDPGFQEWVIRPKNKNYVPEDGQHIDEARSKFSFDKHPRHNEISLLLYHLLDHVSIKTINSQNKKAIKHAVYWHHAKPFRKNHKVFENLGDVYKKLDKNLGGDAWENVVLKSTDMLSRLCGLDSSYREIKNSLLRDSFQNELDRDALDYITSLPFPEYKEYSIEDLLECYTNGIKKNGLNNVIRACVITADRWISALSANDLDEAIANHTLDELVEDKLQLQSDLNAHIEQCLTSFPNSERTQKQAEVAQKLTDQGEYGVTVLSGAAGCGKTKIALEWAKLKNAQQILWICPRVQVCQGLFEELASDRYLPNATVEIHTGEFKYLNTYSNPTPENEFFSGDIVITTIDQILNSIISHTNANKLIDYLNAHVVFDEYHEYINMPAFNLFFAELVEVKNRRESAANTLLVSATPNYLFTEELLERKREDIVEMESFNQSRYKIKFVTYEELKNDESNPLYGPQKDNTFIISNTAITAQKSFIQNQQNESSILLHSKFKKSDKKTLFAEVFDSFQQYGSRKYDILRSGPIVQAALNITCDYMVSEISTAENCLQRLGRLDRFGENNESVNIFCLAVPDPISQGKGIGTSARFLSRNHCLASTKAWYEFLANYDLDKPLTLKTIYQIYEDYYKPENGKINFIRQDLIDSLKTSASLIEDKVTDPIVIPPKKGEKLRSKISKRSLRGDNRFVQMAVCDVSNPIQPIFLDEYAYEIPADEKKEIDNLTASVTEIEGYGDSSRNLLAHMMKKHHNIKGGSKPYKDFILLNEARDPESPVYLSYTPADLIPVGGGSARHDHAIYYAVCDKQAVGSISIQQLGNNGD